MRDIPIEKPAGKTRLYIFLFLCAGLCAVLLFVGIKIKDNSEPHTAADFGFEDLKSPVDADSDGIDDWSDMLAGARAYIATDPEYKSAYYAGAYPPDGEGVCTDVIWRAFSAAGYSLKDLIDADIEANKDEYPDSEDPNIDFRRVRNLLVFFRRNAEELTTSTSDPEDWMPGDIVIFDGHIALCSDVRNADGIPYLIHHGNNITRAHEGNDINYYKIVGHFRWKG